MDILKNLSYCPPNVTIFDIWVDHGLSHCFLDTVSSSVLAGFIVIFGTIQLIMYYKYAMPIEDSTQISRSKLYYFQLLLLTMIPSLSVLRFILESFLFPDAHLYGYTVKLNTPHAKVVINKLNSQFFLDFGIIVNVSLILVFHLVGVERTFLFIAISTNGRSWSNFTHFLDAGLYQWEYFGYKLEERTMVDSCFCNNTR